jgi:hypothetical protein
MDPWNPPGRPGGYSGDRDAFRALQRTQNSTSAITSPYQLTQHGMRRVESSSAWTPNIGPQGSVRPDPEDQRRLAILESINMNHTGISSHRQPSHQHQFPNKPLGPQRHGSIGNPMSPWPQRPRQPTPYHPPSRSITPSQSSPGGLSSVPENWIASTNSQSQFTSSEPRRSSTTGSQRGLVHSPYTGSNVGRGLPTQALSPRTMPSAPAPRGQGPTRELMRSPSMTEGHSHLMGFGVYQDQQGPFAPLRSSPSPNPLRPNSHPQDSSLLTPVPQRVPSLPIHQNQLRIGQRIGEVSAGTGWSQADVDPDHDLAEDRMDLESSLDHGESHNRPRLVENIQDPEEEHDRVICALSESRTSDVIGMAAVNLTVGHVELTRFVRDQGFQLVIETLSRMPVFPQTFLVLKKVVDSHAKSSLVAHIDECFPGVQIVPIDRDHWNESRGLKLIDRLAWKRDVKALRRNLENNFYVSCAFSAVRTTDSHNTAQLVLT